LIATHIILYYYHHGSLKNLVKNTQGKKPNKKNQPKKLCQNGQVQINLSKMTLWSSWTWGQKNHSGFFLLKFPIKKSHDFN
jgi:hypothetical protein